MELLIQAGIGARMTPTPHPCHCPSLPKCSRAPGVLCPHSCLGFAFFLPRGWRERLQHATDAGWNKPESRSYPLKKLPHECHRPTWVFSKSELRLTPVSPAQGSVSPQSQNLVGAALLLGR